DRRIQGCPAGRLWRVVRAAASATNAAQGRTIEDWGAIQILFDCALAECWPARLVGAIFEVASGPKRDGCFSRRLGTGSPLRVPPGRYLLRRLLELIQGWAFNTSSPPGLVAVIGAESGGCAPANPRMDGAAYARASQF